MCTLFLLRTLCETIQNIQRRKAIHQQSIFCVLCIRCVLCVKPYSKFLLLFLQLISMTKLSVNINKIATLRNSRGGNNPDLVKTALDIERFGAQGITVHPRPDERHIRYRDVYGLKKVISTELNIEGNCTEEKFVAMVLASQPAQVTLMPDAEGQITSNHGWNTVEHKDFLVRMISLFKNAGIRTSIFVDPVIEMVEGAAATGTDRIELYTENFAKEYAAGNKEAAVKDYTAAANFSSVQLPSIFNSVLITFFNPYTSL